MGMSNAVLEQMRDLANGYAKERIQEYIELVENATDENGEVDAVALEQAVGRIVAVSYAKGYADCYENVKVRRLLF